LLKRYLDLTNLPPVSGAAVVPYVQSGHGILVPYVISRVFTVEDLRWKERDVTNFTLSLDKKILCYDPSTPHIPLRNLVIVQNEHDLLLESVLVKDVSYSTICNVVKVLNITCPILSVTFPPSIIGSAVVLHVNPVKSHRRSLAVCSDYKSSVLKKKATRVWDIPWNLFVADSWALGEEYVERELLLFLSGAKRMPLVRISPFLSINPVPFDPSQCITFYNKRIGKGGIFLPSRCPIPGFWSFLVSSYVSRQDDKYFLIDKG